MNLPTIVAKLGNQDSQEDYPSKREGTPATWEKKVEQKGLELKG